MIAGVVYLFGVFICIIKWGWWIFGTSYLQVAEKYYKTFVKISKQEQKKYS